MEIIILFAAFQVGSPEFPKPPIFTGNDENYKAQILYPPIELAEETPKQFPKADDKPKIGGSELRLAYFNASAKLPEWTLISNPIWPIYITQKFSVRHPSLDLNCNFREPIYATNDGIITTASYGYNKGYGNLVIISHNNEFQTLYAHNDQIFVKKGQQVEGGQIIGSCGNTGRSFGTHSHWGLIWKGEFINPIHYLRQ